MFTMQVPTRVSCTALARFYTKGRREAFLIEDAYGVFGLVGGGIMATSKGRADLWTILNLDENSFENEYDLRFKLPAGLGAAEYKHLLAEFETWFHFGLEREVKAAVVREAYEELCVEAKILTPNQVSQLVFSRFSLIEEVGAGTGARSDGVLTKRYFEVYDVSIPDAVMEVLMAAAQDPASGLIVATEDEIRNGQTRGGDRIGHAAKLIYTF